jgi:TRAP-type C4-dicarboxylate transport system permease small subunit
MMASSVPIRMSIVYAVMPLCFALTLPVSLETILQRLRRRTNADREVA